MPIPDYQSLMLPVLQLLAAGADHTAGSVIAAMSSEFGLTPEEREQLVGSQRISLMASPVHWAMTYLAQAGLSLTAPTPPRSRNTMRLVAHLTDHIRVRPATGASAWK